MGMVGTKKTGEKQDEEISHMGRQMFGELERCLRQQI